MNEKNESNDSLQNNDEAPSGNDDQQQKSFPIVGIGASAGGLQALQEFFSEMPVDSGIGFVVVTHVRPDRESLLPEILSKATEIPIVASDKQTRIEPNKVIIAKDAFLSVSGGSLHALTDDHEKEETHHPIDHFFRSLASDKKDLSIGVILSGTGNDGTLGLKAIKAAGGMVMVQRPDSAKYPGMPESALETNLADYVLRPDMMPEALVEYCRGPYLKRKGQAGDPRLSNDTIQAILVRLKSYTGQDFTGYKKSTVSRRIERRMNVHRINEPHKYLEYIRENPRELYLLLQELLISVTSFFRDPEAFDALAEKALPKLLESREDGYKLRVWVPGCATGEEAYSVAIALHEQVQKIDRMQEVQIFATDLDERAIEVARSGVYPEGIAADITPERLKQHFSKENGSYRIHKNLRDMVVFAIQNIISDPPFSRLDLIVCRNVLIYLDSEAQQRVLPVFHYALRPGGLLFLGTSETLGNSANLFETIDGKYKILRRKETPAQIHPALKITAPKVWGNEEPEFKEQSTHQTTTQFVRSSERLLMNEFVPCSIIVDEKGTVLYVHGRSGMYLEPEQGPPKNEILQMAREGLRAPLAIALEQARKEDQTIIRHSIKVKTNGEFTYVDLRVRRLRTPEILRELLLVTLQSSEPRSEAVSEISEEDLSPEEVARCEQLEKDLQYTRENLQTTIEELETSNEELKSSNEELQSTNEELHSANEELETSKEEMQSLNEELNTVNSELESKVSALGRTNDDMNNLLNSMQVATIFLDRDLKVKRYTEQARDLVRLIESDIGRPLSDLTSNLNYDRLIQDCEQVIESLQSKEREITDKEGRWHLVRLIPYRTSDDLIDGLVITIVNIDRTKKAECEARAGRAYFENIVQTVREPLLILNGELRVISANRSFYNTFCGKPGEIENRSFLDLDDSAWDIPDLKKLLKEILPENTEVTDFRVEYDFPKIGHRVFLLNARQVREETATQEMILLAFEDITEKE